MRWFQLYKQKFHFSVNFYGIFLLITFIPDIIGMEPSLIVYAFWGLKALLAFWVILRYRKRLYDLQFGEQLFMFVCFIYFVNLFVDLFMQNDYGEMGSRIDLLSFFISILIAVSFRYDPAFGSEKSFTIFLITLSLGLFIAFFLAQESPPPLVGRFDANTTVNSINYGQMGCALCLMAVYGLVAKRFAYSRLIFLALFCLGAVSIMKAGSRSPIVVLAFVGFFYAMTRLGFVKGVFICIVVGLITWLSLDFLVELGKSFDSGLAERVISAVEDRETSGRDEIYANTLQIIRQSPLFGDFYLISSGTGRNGYPHNFFLEAFLTTGIIGGIPFMVMVGIALVKSVRLLQSKHRASWIVLLFLQLLVYGMFSSALYSSQDFWALCLFVVSALPERVTERQGLGMGKTRSRPTRLR